MRKAIEGATRPMRGATHRGEHHFCGGSASLGGGVAAGAGDSVGAGVARTSGRRVAGLRLGALRSGLSEPGKGRPRRIRMASRASDQARISCAIAGASTGFPYSSRLMTSLPSG